LSRDISWFRIW